MFAKGYKIVAAIAVNSAGLFYYDVLKVTLLNVMTFRCRASVIVI